MSFTLDNTPAEPKRGDWKPCKDRQKVLFSGMDCLPGQLDLFPTDGDADGDNPDEED